MNREFSRPLADKIGADIARDLLEMSVADAASPSAARAQEIALMQSLLLRLTVAQRLMGREPATTCAVLGALGPEVAVARVGMGAEEVLAKIEASLEDVRARAEYLAGM